MNEENAIWADSLTKTYRSGDSRVGVFRDLTLRVPVGERLAIVGESGAGKSTLLHLLGGLDRPDAGEIGFHQTVLSSLSRTQLARFQNRQLGFVWQQPSLLPEFTALENVMMPLLIGGMPKAPASERAQLRLNEVGLGHRTSHLAGELSGGEQQRVAIARAIAAEPKYLLADEPTGNLDSRSGQSVMELLSHLHQTHRLTSVFVTHNDSFARQCDRTLELRKGQLELPAATGAIMAGVIQGATRLDGGTYV